MNNFNIVLKTNITTFSLEIYVYEISIFFIIIQLNYFNAYYTRKALAK